MSTLMHNEATVSFDSFWSLRHWRFLLLTAKQTMQKKMLPAFLQLCSQI